MRITTTQYAEALYEAINQTSPNDHDLVLDNFVKILAQNDDLAKHAEIEKEYKILEMKARGISQAEITVARDMEVNSLLVDELNKVVAGKVEIKKRVDEGIVGGVVVRVDDTLIDASVRGQLDKLNQSLRE